MPRRATALTGSAGEHFVAYALSARGYPVALTRGGSPTVDLMVGNLSGTETLSIQVKTSNWAWRWFKRKPANNHWEWDVGWKATQLRGASIFYAFVDLKWDPETAPTPDVFIVPSDVVANAVAGQRSRYMFWIMEADANQYRDNWRLLTDRLDVVHVELLNAAESNMAAEAEPE